MSEPGRSSAIVQASPLANYDAHRAEIDAAIARVLASGRYIRGDEVDAFEREFAEYLGVHRAVGVANGTDAVELALRACGIAAGDTVFVPGHTAVATVAAVERASAVPVLVDIDPATYTIAPEALDRAARAAPRGRRAVVAVHFYGCPANMTAITDVANRHDLIVVEDCAQAHGAAIENQQVGALGRAAAFSFYPTKNLGALGDGGAVVTNDPAIAERVRLLREYGWRERFMSEVTGFNSRLDELQAAVLRVKLPHLGVENAARVKRAQAYTSALAGTGITIPVTPKGTTHVFHQYVIRLERRDALRAFLDRRQIGTAIHYPMPLHLQPAYRDRIRLGGSLAECERAARMVLSLPMYAELPMADVSATALAIAEWVRHEGKER